MNEEQLQRRIRALESDLTMSDERFALVMREHDRWVEVVQAVAKGPTMMGISTMYLCNFCDVYVGGIFGRTDHRANCPVTKARALLNESATLPAMKCS